MSVPQSDVEAKLAEVSPDSTARGKAIRALKAFKAKAPEVEISEDNINLYCALKELLPSGQNVTWPLMKSKKKEVRKSTSAGQELHAQWRRVLPEFPMQVERA